jgi:hypothetical protein
VEAAGGNFFVSGFLFPLQAHKKPVEAGAGWIALLRMATLGGFVLQGCTQVPPVNLGGIGFVLNRLGGAHFCTKQRILVHFRTSLGKVASPVALASFCKFILLALECAAKRCVCCCAF